MGKKKQEMHPEEEPFGLADEVAEVISQEAGGEESPTLATEIDYQAEAAKNKDHYLRALADLENYRKRAQREKEDAIRYANSNLLREMIPVIDNLERAVEHACEDGDRVLLEGVQMTLVQFRKVLEGFGVKMVESLGEPFNPEYHQAMGEVMTSDCAPGRIAQEMQKGYVLNGRLLRPALVMIARAPAGEETQTSDGPDAETGAGES